MTSNTKKQYSNAFKFKVALAALKDDKTTATLCREFALHESQLSRWKKQLKENGPDLFNNNVTHNSKEEALKQQIKELNEHIGEITIENKFLKKNLNL